MNKGIIGFRLKAARIHKGYSLTELSKETGVSRPTLSRYENGIVYPSLPTAVLIAKALDVDLNYLGGM